MNAAAGLSWAVWIACAVVGFWPYDVRGVYTGAPLVRLVKTRSMWRP